MHINILIDKSTFQLLSRKELIRLNCYYTHNVAPILVMEILGDLKKEAKEGKPPSEAIVLDFAKKLFPFKSVVNAYYRRLVIEELLGEPACLDGRPHLGVEKIIKADDGSKGFLLEQTDEEKSIYKWKEGNFSDADKELSQIWRTVTTQEDLLINLQKILQKTKGAEKITSLKAAIEKVDSLLSDINRQDSFLAFLIDNYSDDQTIGIDVFRQWTELGRPLLLEFAPYSYHCLRVDLLFHFTLQHQLIGTRPTNRVDLEYLYYLPFCNVFTSNDKLHKQLAPLLLRPDQKFVIGEDLKRDLKSIVEFLEDGGDEKLKEFSDEPPQDQNSITYQIWVEHNGDPKGEKFKRELSEKEMEYMRSQMNKFERAARGEAVAFEEGEEENFIVRESFLHIDDDCYCGSGKPLIECHMTREQFISLSRDPKNKKL